MNKQIQKNDSFYLLLIWSVATVAIMATILLIYINIHYKAINRALQKQNTQIALNTAPKQKANVYILYEKNEKLKSCQLDEICEQTTLVTSSGALVTQGSTDFVASLNLASLKRIQNEIKETGIMEKICLPPVVIDNNYPVDYTLNIDGKTKKIQFRGCENELKKIDFLINEYKTKYCVQDSDCVISNGGSCCADCGNPIIVNTIEANRLDKLKKIDCAEDKKIKCAECQMPAQLPPSLQCVNNLCTYPPII